VAIRNATGQFAEHPVYNTATEFRFECEYASGVKMIVGTEERFGVTFEGTDGWAWSTRQRHETSSLDIFESQISPNEIKLYQSDDHPKNFIDSVFTSAKTVAPIEVAHRTITVAHLANIALMKGRDLRWDPAEEKILDDPGASAMLSRQYRQPWDLG
jgi:5-methylthioribose kinase